MKPQTPRLPEGAPAPEFEALAQDGRPFRLRDFRGRWVVLYFYPRDHTPGCTREACEFRDAHAQFQKLGAVVIGVSTDTVASHARFAERQRLPFLLLADPDRSLVQQYGVWGRKRFMGRTIEGTLRTTFLIDPEGRIRRIWHGVRPAGHAAEVLEALRQLQKEPMETEDRSPTPLAKARPRRS
ncbi:thioredoxin-dependent thiol peroxidase [Limisphaera sp. VF-2]|jgi:peroxiredoxin Q/BCP|uniref:thioredoxin-dependent thiol peroxidase n=1 Tax=Limisphaera sp. VF-2 TaxID=3400418 RepID=UPI00176B9098|nr:thioredoxin-dependent thiol peroxidase [Limisphaera sp.]